MSVLEKEILINLKGYIEARKTKACVRMYLKLTGE